MKPSFKQFRSAGATLLAARYKLQSTLILGLALVAVSLGNTAQAKSRSFPISAPTSQPISITMGPDGNFWFTEQNSSRVARITPLGVITECIRQHARRVRSPIEDLQAVLQQFAAFSADLTK
jgi:hypothetical protein